MANILFTFAVGLWYKEGNYTCLSNYLTIVKLIYLVNFLLIHLAQTFHWVMTLYYRQGHFLQQSLILKWCNCLGIQP